MARTGIAAAVNARVGQIVEYAADHRGAGMFAALSGVHHRGVDGTDGTRVVDVDGGRTFHGISPTPQRFIGIAPLGVARPVTRRTATISDERAVDSFNDIPLKIFAQRLARGQR